jgi:hypothetical protein
VAQQVTFGRRSALTPTPAPVRAPDRLEAWSPQLEAFVASLKDAEPSEAAEFARWRQQQLPNRLLVIVLGLALLAPGLVCFLIKTPLWVSLCVEAAGFVANAWLRHVRRRNASAIAGWAPDR